MHTHKDNMLLHLPEVQDMAQATALDYAKESGEQVHVTPTTYLLFLETYAHVFMQKDTELQLAIKKFKRALKKLDQVAEEIKEMLTDIEDSEGFLIKAQSDSADLLKQITSQQSVLERKKKAFEEAAEKTAALEADVTAEQAAIAKEISVADPYVKNAKDALHGIGQKEQQVLKGMKSPAIPVKVVMDCVLILLHKPLNAIKVAEDKGVHHYRDSYASAYLMMQDGTLMDEVQKYTDNLLNEENEESIELLQPYLENSLFSFEGARKSSAMASSLLHWIKSLDEYYGVVGAVNPRRRKLNAKESAFAFQKKSFAIIEEDLNKTNAEMEEMQNNLREAVNAKADIQTETEMTKEKVKFANKLIRALAGEKTRWMACAGDFQLRLAALPGNASVAACFLSYCGLMSHTSRSQLRASVMADLHTKGLPKYEDFCLVDFLSTERERGTWTSQGLAADVFSVENGILVTKALRWPLLIDPEGQGLEWIIAKEQDNMLKATAFGDLHFLQIFEDCASHGRPLVIENVTDGLDPSLNSVLDKRLAIGEQDEVSIQINGKDVICCKGFVLYLITKLPHPGFGPDTSNRTTVISFKVSMESLQEQLFAYIVEKERPEFQSQKIFTLGEVRSLLQQKTDIEDDILTKIYGSSQQGSILDDVSLLDVLDKVKEIDRMVKEKEKIVDGISQKIDQSCTDMKAVSKRASALYAAILGLALVNPMYRTSLQQFQRIFKRAVSNPPKENNMHLKVQAMNHELTWSFFRNLNRGVFEKDKTLFTLLICLQIVMFEGLITEDHFRCLIEGGALLNSEAVRPKPYNWLPSDSWLNIIALFETFDVLKDLPDSIQHLGDQWRSWYDSATPEAVKFPEIPSAFDKITPFLHLTIVRAIRPDRTMMAARRFVTEVLNDKYNDAPACDLEEVHADSDSRTPLIFLLSSGADPTGLILALARKLKREIMSVSMGQGQDGLARRNFDTGIQIGSWLLLQNVHLDLKFLSEIEQSFHKVESIEEDFRLFLTTQIAPAFPAGLLQMSIKVTNEAPVGVKEGLRRIYSLINQDMIEAVPRAEWRSILFSLAFMHSVMLARRRFDECGWSSPIDFSHGDFTCCATFLQNQFKELETKKRKEVHWETLRNMVVQNMYGSNRSDVSDLRIMRTLSEKYLSPLVLETNFMFSLNYPMPAGTELASFRSSIEAYPDMDRLELLGMSATAEFVAGLQHTHAMLAKLRKTIARPEGTTGPTRVPESTLLQKVGDLLQKFPHPFVAAEVRESLEKEGGMKLPTNVAFKHELNVFDNVVKMAQQGLQKAHNMLGGTLTPSEHLWEVANDVYVSKVPRSWEKISWPAQNLGHWMVQLQHRLEQWKRWLERGRPFSFWLAGFTNPAGFLAALKQEVASKQKGWGLENCTLFTEVTKLDPSDLKGPPENGAYVHGLCLEGASWNRKEGKIVDSLTKLPVLYICVVLKSAKKYDYQVYECPCYSRRQRGRENFVFTANLKTEELPTRWILRGVALLCSKD